MSFYSAFSDEVLTNIDKDLALIDGQLDSELTVLSNTTQQVAASKEIKTRSNNFSPENINEIKYMLANYNATSDFTEDIFLCLPNIGYIVSTSTSCAINYFTQNIFRFQNITPYEMEQFFKSPIVNFMSIDKNNKTMYSNEGKNIIFAYPIYTDYLKQVGTIVFNVKNSTIEKFIKPRLLKYSAETFILDDKQRIVIHIGEQPEIVSQMTDDLKKMTLSQALDHYNGYVIRQYKSPNTSYKYITLIPKNQKTFSQISLLNYRFLFSILIVVILSSIFMFYAIKFNYKPLSILHNKASKLINSSSSFNEISDIEQALEVLNGKNIYLSSRLEDSIGSIINMRLRKLLTNYYETVDDFNLDCQELDVKFTTNHLFVTSSCIHTKNCNLDQIGMTLKLHLVGFLESYYIYPVETNRLIMIHCVPEGTSLKESQLIQIFSDLHANIYEKFGILVTTGIGSVITDITELSRSYLESSTALDYRFVKGKGQIISFSEIYSSATKKIVYPHKYFDKLKNAIQVNNEDNINQCIDDVIDVIEKTNFPLSMARGICFDLINVVTQTTIDQAGEKLFPKPNLFVLSEIETIQELVSILKSWHGELSKLKESHVKVVGNVDIKEVIDYLNKTCLDCNFSIYETAEHFGMQLPKFSQFFKEKTDQNVLDCTMQIRMNEAKRLLIETNEEIKSIALKTGYYNTSSFIRRFKQTQGITPGDFRKCSGKKIFK